MEKLIYSIFSIYLTYCLCLSLYQFSNVYSIELALSIRAVVLSLIMVQGPWSDKNFALRCFITGRVWLIQSLMDRITVNTFFKLLPETPTRSVQRVLVTSSNLPNVRTLWYILVCSDTECSHTPGFIDYSKQRQQTVREAFSYIVILTLHTRACACTHANHTILTMHKHTSFNRAMVQSAHTSQKNLDIVRETCFGTVRMARCECALKTNSKLDPHQSSGCPILCPC